MEKKYGGKIVSLGKVLTEMGPWGVKGQSALPTTAKP